MSRPFAIKQLFTIALVAALIMAAIGAFHLQGNSSNTPGELSASDKAWLKERLAHPPVPAPKSNQPRVILAWRAPLDVPKVHPFVSQVDHPEGLNGVYGIDLTTSDPLAATLKLSEISQGFPAQGAWLVVQNGSGGLLGETPIINNSTIETAFQMAQGNQVSFPGSGDPYLNQPAPDFTTQTQDGKPITLSALKGKKIVLTFYCGCERCAGMASELARVQKTPAYQSVEFLTVTHMTPYRAKQFSQETGQTYTVLKETEHGIASLYNSVTCPRVWYIGPDGMVHYYSHLGEDPKAVVPALTEAVQG